MSTPVGKKSSEAERPHHDNVFPEELNKEIVSSDRCNLTTRRRQLCSSTITELLNAPKAKRTRPSCINTDNLNCHEKDLKCPDGKSPSAPRCHLPIPRLLFDNEDFMDMFQDDHNQDSVRRRPDSVASLSQSLSDAFDPFITGPPLKKP